MAIDNNIKTLNNIVWYFKNHHPRFDWMYSVERIEICYLADWKHVLDNDYQITNTEWRSGYIMYAKENPFLKPLFQPESAEFTGSELKTLNHVIKSTKDKSPPLQTRLVKSTWPLIRGPVLDLRALARSYNKYLEENGMEGYYVRQQGIPDETTPG